MLLIRHNTSKCMYMYPPFSPSLPPPPPPPPSSLPPPSLPPSLPLPLPPSQVYSDPRVTQRLKELLVSWANEFKNDPQMSGLHRFIEQLQREGISFARLQQTPATAATRGQVSHFHSVI